MQYVKKEREIKGSNFYRIESPILKLCFSPEGKQEKQEKLQSCSLWNKNHIHRKTDKMKRQRTMYQMKEQDKTPEKQLNEVEKATFQKKNSE